MTQAPETSPALPAGKKPQEEENFFVFLFKLAVIVLVFRSFIFSPFNIPSESMLPRLVNGDYLLAAKWPYGFSSYSLPFSLPLIPGRVLASEPKRGDIAIFKAPPANNVDYIKRVIGLPGDTIQMKGGVLFINGVAVPKVKVADFEVAVSPNTSCYQPRYGASVNYEMTKPDGEKVCHYPQFRETLPNGKSYNVLDMEVTPKDDTEPYIVPQGNLFMMGDDRDNSLDSRFATEENGIGYVPQANLVGRATIMMWSTDGSSSWIKPWTWVSAARWKRIGGTF
jgi:signal peptidase I